MFDVDKLYTYNYSTKEYIDENGKSRLVKDDSKSLYNDLLDIHLSIFDNNNEDLYKLVLAPNGFGKLKNGDGSGLAKDIDEIKTRVGKVDSNFLSTQYQMMKFYNGVSGKAGVGVFSSLAMFNAMCQDKELQYVNTSVIDGMMHDNFDVRFGDYSSTGKLGLTKTLKGDSYVSKVIEAFQSASVDNEKEQILYKLNINRHTFATINALAMLGFDETTICYFINQPIIEKYVKAMSDKDSSLEKFSETMTGDVFLDISNEIKEKYAIDEDYKARNYGDAELKDLLSTPEQDRDSSFWAKQLALLSKFSDINAIGNTLQSTMQTINAESKGLGRTVFGSLDREDKIDNIGSVNAKYGVEAVSGVKGAERLLYAYDDKKALILDRHDRPIPGSQNGFVAEYATMELNKIARRLFPYDNKIIKGLFSYASTILQRRGDSISANEEFMSKTFTAMKAYMFSNNKLFGNTDLRAERARLFLGTYKLSEQGHQVVDQPALADIIDSIKSVEGGIGDTNALLRMLTADLRMKSSDVKLVKYTASAGKNMDESELHQAFIALFREDQPIEYKIDDKTHTIQSQDLAVDLIKYAYLSGGSQEAIQFTRYMPIEVLTYMGFNDVLKDMAKSFNANTFGANIDGEAIIDANVIEQMLQHNPSSIPVKVKGKMVVDKSENLANGMKNVSYKTLLDGSKVITKFELNVDSKNLVDKKANTGLHLVGQKYLAGRFKNSYLIYKLNGGVYESIPVLGTFGVKEYDFNLPAGQVAESIIASRNLIDRSNKDSKVISSEPEMVIKDNKFKASAIYDLNGIKSKNAIQSTLSMIMMNETSSNYHRDIASRLLSNENLLASLSHILISYADINAKGVFLSSRNYKDRSVDEIQIASSNKIILNKDELDRAILHEIVHAYTLNSIVRFQSGDKTLPDNVSDSIKKIDALRRSLKYKFNQDTAFKKSWDRVAGYGKGKNTESLGFLEPMDMIAYGLISNDEFVTTALEDPIFRQYVTSGDENFNKSTSVLSKLWDALLELLGLNSLSKINKDYIANEIFQFINEINQSLDKNVVAEFKSEKLIDNAKFRVVEDILNSIEKPTEIKEESTESLSPAVSESVDLSLSKDEISMLEAKHGENALSDYNQLSDEEKEYIIKCLR